LSKLPLPLAKFRVQLLELSFPHPVSKVREHVESFHRIRRFGVDY
jgi:hypothetical protein